jgi:hypothetical protein
VLDMLSMGGRSQSGKVGHCSEYACERRRNILHSTHQRDKIAVKKRTER